MSPITAPVVIRMVFWSSLNLVLLSWLVHLPSVSTFGATQLWQAVSDVQVSHSAGQVAEQGEPVETGEYFPLTHSVHTVGLVHEEHPGGHCRQPSSLSI